MTDQRLTVRELARCAIAIIQIEHNRAALGMHPPMYVEGIALTDQSALWVELQMQHAAAQNTVVVPTPWYRRIWRRA